MPDVLDIWEQPEAKEVYMIAGWRQWADAGSISSSLPRYLAQQTGARKIGTLAGDGFYLFQIPGTHDLVRPTVRFEEGYPEELEVPQNEFYYAGNEERGVVFFIGDEPHQNVEAYVAALLDAAAQFGVQRIVAFGGVYGELPYDKERTISAVYSLRRLKKEIEALAVDLSSYHGGASIGSYVCRRAGDRGMEYVGLYAFVPTYDFSNVAEIGNTIRLENDFMAWRGVVRRVNHMLGVDFDLDDLDEKCYRLVQVIDDKVEELDGISPQLQVRAYMDRLAEDFEEIIFEPLGEVWEAELRRLFDEGDELDDEAP
jgi:proteasome assembly chaperone (PAC2) family protein